MMKKIILLLSSMTFCLLTAQAKANTSPFTGLYLNLGGGGIIASFDIQQQLTLNLPTILDVTNTNAANVYNASGLGSFELGYKQQVSRHFVIGISATADIEDAKVNSKTLFQEANSQFIITKNVRAKLKNTFALLIEPSFVIAPKSLLYVLIGPRWGNFQVSTQASYSQNVALAT